MTNNILCIFHWALFLFILSFAIANDCKIPLSRVLITLGLGFFMDVLVATKISMENQPKGIKNDKC